MKKLIFLITIIAATSLVRAGENEEIIWETEQIGGLNEVEISPLGEHSYNTKDSIVQVRSVETGELIEEILFPNTNRLDAISISADGRLMAVSGEPEYIFIYDLVEKREVNRLTTTLLEREEYGKIKKYLTEEWHNSSISPDGTKVAGIAEGNQPTGTTSWVVFDIETGVELVKETRIGYDNLNPDKYGAGAWISTEFTPNGSYIISQLEYDDRSGTAPDSIYIHDANTLEVYDVVLNKYWDDRQTININPNSEKFIYHGNSNSYLYETYHFSDKLTQKVLNQYLWTFTFLRTRDYIIYGHDNGLSTYDYKNDITIYDYELVTNVFTTTLDDSKLLANYHGHIYCLKTFLNETNIANEYDEEILVSPNPTQSTVDISIECFEPIISYSIYNLDSTLITQNTFENQQNSFTIDFSPYPSGTYFLTFTCNDKIKTYKIIKEG